MRMNSNAKSSSVAKGLPNNNCKKNKSVDELREQWAGGRDIWPRVPVDDDANIQGGGDRKKRLSSSYVSIQTKVKESSSGSIKPGNNNKDNKTIMKKSWPKIVKESILYGLGACNPRGQEVPMEINEKQHALLHTDIQKALFASSSSSCDTLSTYWESAALWEDNSSEKGFILAFPRRSSQREDFGDKGEHAAHPPGLELSVELARKYNQGAIYKFQFDQNGNTLIRDTVPVLDEGSDARVEVEIDDSAGTIDDPSPF